MAKIPTGQFGQMVAQPSNVQTVAVQKFVPEQAIARNADAPGKALSNLGAAGLAIADAEMKRQEAIQLEERRQRTEVERAQSVKSLFEYELATKTLQRDIQNKVQTGELPYQKAKEVLTSEVEKIKTDDFSPTDVVTKATYEAAIGKTKSSVFSEIENTVQTAERSDYRSKFDASLDTLGKIAGLPNEDIGAINLKAEQIAVIGKKAGLNDAEISKKIQDFKDNNWTNHANQKFINANDSMEALTKLKDDLGEKGFYSDKLDAAKRIAIFKVIDSRMDVLTTRALHFADKQEAKAQRTLDDVEKQISSGYPPTAEQLLNWQTNVKGTQYEGQYSALVDSAKQINAVLNQPIEQQSAYLQKMKMDMLKNGADSKQQANFNRLSAAVDANIKTLKEQPLVFSQNRTGLKLEAVDFNNPETMSDQLKDRFSTVTALRNRYGAAVPLNPWLPEEVDQVKLTLAQSNDKQKLGMLSSIAKSSPDASAYAAALKPIAADNPFLMLAGMAEYRGLKSTEGRSIAETVLAGEKILRDKSVIMPTENAFKVKFNEYIGDSIDQGSPERAQVYQMFKALYAGNANEKNIMHSDTNSELDETIAKNAINQATGGIYVYQGRSVIKPYGMADNAFEAKVSAAIKSISGDNSVLKSHLEDLPLKPHETIENSYYFMSGNRRVKDKNNKPYIIKIDPTAPNVSTDKNDSYFMGLNPNMMGAL